MKDVNFPIAVIHEKGFRSYQEDAFGYVYLSPLWIFVVADGMGGMDKGDLASQIAVNEIIKVFQENRTALRDEEIVKLFKEGIVRSSNAIGHLVSENEIAASTLILAVWNEATRYLWLTWAGDSRIYLMLGSGEKGKPDPAGKDGRYCVAMDNQGYRLYALTEDHSVVWTFFKKGELTFDQLKDHPYKNKVTLSLSSSIPIHDLLKQLRVRKYHLTVQETATLFLCTDGVWESLEHSLQLLNVLKQSNENPEKAAREIRQIVRRQQGKVENGDNYTAIVTNLSRLSTVQEKEIHHISSTAEESSNTLKRLAKKRGNLLRKRWSLPWPFVLGGSLLLLILLVRLLFFELNQKTRTRIGLPVNKRLLVENGQTLQKFFQSNEGAILFLYLDEGNAELLRILRKHFPTCNPFPVKDGYIALWRAPMKSVTVLLLYDLENGRLLCTSSKRLPGSPSRNVSPKSGVSAKKLPPRKAESKSGPGTPKPDRASKPEPINREQKKQEKTDSNIVSPQQIGQKKKK